ncbi:hypothetical protein QR680_009295 [Steinernema hermaphroditum]|uniref:E3 ubiquitin-protein ligase ZNRF1 n=1 Tax=Steinernema hermaphroditum TaxID=289476 RepID=A0AA39M9M5_9BILA|nr:hypothetical protein QR680_009295 [Steinernema hermaphroditum]
MGGRQSVQTDVERRPRSNSAVETPGEIGTNTRRHASTSAVSTRDVSNHAHGSTSDSEEEGGGSTGSANVHANSLSGFRLIASNGRSVNRSQIAQFFQQQGSSGSRSHRRSMGMFHLLAQDVKCPVCNTVVPSDTAELHFVICLTKPRLGYNDDILTDDKGECAICLEDMAAGDKIARLPCLCIYHKKCIDEWFERKNCCPEHPGDE